MERVCPLIDIKIVKKKTPRLTWCRMFSPGGPRYHRPSGCVKCCEIRRRYWQLLRLPSVSPSATLAELEFDPDQERKGVQTT